MKVFVKFSKDKGLMHVIAAARSNNRAIIVKLKKAGYTQTGLRSNSPQGILYDLRHAGYTGNVLNLKMPEYNDN